MFQLIDSELPYMDQDRKVPSISLTHTHVHIVASAIRSAGLGDVPLPSINVFIQPYGAVVNTGTEWRYSLGIMRGVDMHK